MAVWVSLRILVFGMVRKGIICNHARITAVMPMLTTRPCPQQKRCKQESLLLSNATGHMERWSLVHALITSALRLIQTPLTIYTAKSAVITTIKLSPPPVFQPQRLGF